MSRLGSHVGHGSSDFVASSAAAPWQHGANEYAESCRQQGYYQPDTLLTGYKRHREGLGMHGGQVLPANMMDTSISAAVQCGMGYSDTGSPLDWQAAAVLGSDPNLAGQTAALPPGKHNLQGMNVSASSDQGKMMSAQQYSGSTMSADTRYFAPGQSDGTGVHDSQQLLYGKYRSNMQDYANAIASGSMPADQAYGAHQEQLRRQQQQLLLQQQAAEAAAKAAALQQQAALARSAGLASTYSTQAQPVTLYGKYARPPAEQHWNGSSTLQGYSNHHQHHAATAAVAMNASRLPPRPAGSQPQHSAAAEAMQRSAILDYSHAVRSTQQQPPQMVDQRSLFAGSARSSLSSSGSRGSTSTAFPATGPAAPAAVGRWSGPVAVMHSPVLAVSQESDAHSGYALECDEELFLTGMGTGEGYCYQLSNSGNAAAAAGHGQRQQMFVDQFETAQDEVQQELAHLIEDTGSTNNDSDGASDDMDDDQQDVGPAGGARDQFDLDNAALVAAKAAAVAAEQAAAARQSVVLQVLGRVAMLRKGSPALTASTASSTAAESVRSRMLITEVSVYMDRAANSQMALDQANKLMSKMTLPDEVEYMPVLSDSFLFKAGAAWQFPAFVICLGSSYLQRMLARLPQLAEAALACPGFEDYSQYIDQKPAVMPRRLSGPDAVATLATLRSVQFTCLFLATKVADQIHALGLLRFMLTNLSHNGAVVTLQQAANVEASCLDALGWRLGPFFLEDELTGDDEELWAGSMGHWDYGTNNDSYPEHF